MLLTLAPSPAARYQLLNACVRELSREPQVLSRQLFSAKRWQGLQRLHSVSVHTRQVGQRQRFPNLLSVATRVTRESTTPAQARRGASLAQTHQRFDNKGGKVELQQHASSEGDAKQAAEEDKV